MEALVGGGSFRYFHGSFHYFHRSCHHSHRQRSLCKWRGSRGSHRLHFHGNRGRSFHGRDGRVHEGGEPGTLNVNMPRYLLNLLPVGGVGLGARSNVHTWHELIIEGDTALTMKGDTTFTTNSAEGEGGEIHLLRRCDPAVRIGVDGVTILLVCVCLDQVGGRTHILGQGYKTTAPRGRTSSILQHVNTAHIGPDPGTPVWMASPSSTICFFSSSVVVFSDRTMRLFFAWSVFLAFDTDMVVVESLCGTFVLYFETTLDNKVLSCISEASVGAGDLCAVALPTPYVQVSATHDVR